MKTTPDNSSTLTVTCPACGMLCDDILVETTTTVKVKNGCTKSVAFFEQPYHIATPKIAGKTTSLDEAINAAVRILKASRQPLFAGLGTEVQGMRHLVPLAQKTGATLDHMHSESTVRNTTTLQSNGWQTTTLTEIKNRADVILAIGTDIVSTHPRFLDKLVNTPDSLFDKTAPEVLYLCAQQNQQRLPEIISALNALANGKKLTTSEVAGMPTQELEALLAKLQAAQYAVIVWSAGSLKIPHAELTIQGITRLIATLNEKTRAAGLPLNSGDGDTSVNNTSTWLTGYPTRSRLSKNQAKYDSQQFSTKQQLTECDALLWISTFNPHAAPSTNAPTIVIGHPDTPLTTMPDVFIPVGIPGLDHTGTMFRLDSAVALPLKKVRNTDLPSLSTVIAQIESLFA